MPRLLISFPCFHDRIPCRGGAEQALRYVQGPPLPAPCPPNALSYYTPTDTYFITMYPGFGSQLVRMH